MDEGYKKQDVVGDVAHTCVAVCEESLWAPVNGRGVTDVDAEEAEVDFDTFAHVVRVVRRSFALGCGLPQKGGLCHGLATT